MIIIIKFHHLLSYVCDVSSQGRSQMPEDLPSKSVTNRIRQYSLDSMDSLSPPTTPLAKSQQDSSAFKFFESRGVILQSSVRNPFWLMCWWEMINCVKAAVYFQKSSFKSPNSKFCYKTHWATMFGRDVCSYSKGCRSGIILLRSLFSSFFFFYQKGNKVLPTKPDAKKADKELNNTSSPSSRRKHDEYAHIKSL